MPVGTRSGNKVNSGMNYDRDAAIGDGVSVDDEVSEVIKLQCTISEITWFHHTLDHDTRKIENKGSKVI